MNKSFFYAICFVVILVVEIIIGIYVRDSFVRPIWVTHWLLC